jgi:hypothetical protein
MNEKESFSNDEKINQIVNYLNINNDMIDIIYSQLFKTSNSLDDYDKKNELIYKCILPFASYLHINYDERQLEKISCSFEKSLR